MYEFAPAFQWIRLGNHYRWDGAEGSVVVDRWSVTVTVGSLRLSVDRQPGLSIYQIIAALIFSAVNFNQELNNEFR